MVLALPPGEPKPVGDGRIAAADPCRCALEAMPSKDYRIWLSDTACLGVDFVMVKGQIVSFVVRLMRVQPDGSEWNVARYDTAHGAPHRDLPSVRTAP